LFLSLAAASARGLVIGFPRQVTMFLDVQQHLDLDKVKVGWMHGS
jgi:hypothetical protein